MTVSGIRGRRLGKVGAIRDDCFEVRREDADGGPINLTQEALFNVEPRDGATLVCSNDDIDRYRCPAH